MTPRSLNPFNWWARARGQVCCSAPSAQELRVAAQLRNPVEARVVRCCSQGTDTYYLQLQTLAGTWIFACGYHRGAEGFYNYQFCTASNPWTLVDHTLPEIQAELDNPTLPAQNVARAQRNKAADPACTDEVFDVATLKAHTYRPWNQPLDNSDLDNLLKKASKGPERE